MDTDNPSRSFAATCSDWHLSDADCMSARTTTESTLDTRYLSSRYFPQSQTIDQLLAFVGKFMYEGLGVTLVHTG